MKRNFLIAGLIAGAFWLPVALSAQDTPAAAAAEREENEANYKEVKTKIERLEETREAQQKNLALLLHELHSVREDLDRLKSRNETAATQESIKRLAEKIEEVDKKRLADSKLMA